MADFDQIIDKVVLFLVIVAIVPATLVTYFAVDTATWDAGTIALWGIIAILFIVALVKFIMPKKGR